MARRSFRTIRRERREAKKAGKQWEPHTTQPAGVAPGAGVPQRLKPGPKRDTPQISETAKKGRLDKGFLIRTQEGKVTGASKNLQGYVGKVLSGSEARQLTSSLPTRRYVHPTPDTRHYKATGEETAKVIVKQFRTEANPSAQSLKARASFVSEVADNKKSSSVQKTTEAIPLRSVFITKTKGSSQPIDLGYGTTFGRVTPIKTKEPKPIYGKFETAERSFRQKTTYKVLPESPRGGFVKTPDLFKQTYAGKKLDVALDPISRTQRGGYQTIRDKPLTLGTVAVGSYATALALPAVASTSVGATAIKGALFGSSTLYGYQTVKAQKEGKLPEFIGETVVYGAAAYAGFKGGTATSRGVRNYNIRRQFQQKYKNQIVDTSKISKDLATVDKRLSVEIRGRPIEQVRTVEFRAGGKKGFTTLRGIEFKLGNPEIIQKPTSPQLIFRGRQLGISQVGKRASIIGESNLPSTGKDITTPTGIRTAVDRPVIQIIERAKLESYLQTGRIGVVQGETGVSSRILRPGKQSILGAEVSVGTKRTAPYRSVIAQKGTLQSYKPQNGNFPFKEATRGTTGRVRLDYTGGLPGSSRKGLMGTSTEVFSGKGFAARRTYIYESAKVRVKDEFVSVSKPAPPINFNEFVQPAKTTATPSVKGLNVESPAGKGGLVTIQKQVTKKVGKTTTKQSQISGLKQISKTSGINIKTLNLDQSLRKSGVSISQILGRQQSSSGLSGRRSAFANIAAAVGAQTRTGQVPKFKMGQIPKSRQTPRQRYRFKPMQRPIPGTITDTGLKPLGDFGLPITPAPQQPPSGGTDIPGSNEPPNELNLDFEINFPITPKRRSAKRKKKRRSLKPQYVSSVEAVLRGVRGRPSSAGLGGLDIRPLKL